MSIGPGLDQWLLIGGVAIFAFLLGWAAGFGAGRRQPKYPIKPKRDIIRDDKTALADPELQSHMAGGRKINAIKRYRELTGAGLRESKDRIDALMK
jgi:hypothetical protein